jgi:hypothetical protein
MTKLIPKRSENIIILVFTVLMLASILFLAIYEKITRGEILKNSFWDVSFHDPRGSNINFSIENYTNSKEYSWEIMIDDQKISEGKTLVQNREKKNIDVSGLEKDFQDKSGDKKILIRISSGGEKKEIYKYL